MYNTTQDLLDGLGATGDTLQGLVRGYGQEQARMARGGDENWSVIEVICHLRDAEERSLERMRQMRDQERPLLAAYDQDQWAVERNYAGADLHNALAAFLQQRATYLAELAALLPQAWMRQGQHVEQGEITIQSHALHMVSHDALHLAQIARQLRAASPQRQGDVSIDNGASALAGTMRPVT